MCECDCRDPRMLLAHIALEILVELAGMDAIAAYYEYALQPHLVIPHVTVVSITLV